MTPLDSQRMIRLITDFDGPIIDVSERYYRVYHFCLAKSKCDGQPVQPLTKTEFWTLKRSRTPEKKIGLLSGLDEAQAETFSQLRYRTVHTQPYFDHDSLAPGAVTALEKIQQAGIDLAVMTMRRFRELDYAFTRHDLGRFFPEERCYFIENDYEKTQDTQDKPLLMKRAITELPAAKDTWMIGDTEADIISAKMYNIKAVGVLCGIRDREQLEQYNPDFIVNDLSEAVEIVLQQTVSCR